MLLKIPNDYAKKKKYIMTYIMTSQLEKSELQKSDFSAEVHFV